MTEVRSAAPGGFLVAVAEYPWPGTSGNRLRAAGIVAALEELGPVTVVSFNMPDPPPQLAAALDRYWGRRRSQPRRVVDLVAGIVHGNHVSLQRAIAAGVPEAFRELALDLEPRAVILGRPFLGPFLGAARTSACVVIDADEGLVAVNRSVLRSRAPLPARIRATLDLLAVGRMESRDFPKADQVWASSGDEALALRPVARPAPTVAIPNVATRATDRTPPGPVRQVAFVGSLRHPPNAEAALELMRSIMPAVRAADGPSELVLIGREPSDQLRREAARTGNVTVTGEVSDTDALLRQAGILVAPIRSGGGTRLKFLDAAAAGVPIVSTAFGIEGLGLKPGRDVLTAETPDEFAAAINRLRDDHALLEAVVASARAYVEEHHTVAALRRAIKKALEEACPPRGRR